MGVQFATENLQANFAHFGRYSVVEVAGNPSLQEFLSFVAWLANEVDGWSTRRLLVDVRGVTSMQDIEEQRLVGVAAGVVMKGMDRVASLVHPDRYTGASEQEANERGVPLRVFTNRELALSWIQID